MQGQQFRNALRERLEDSADRILLRIIPSYGDRIPVNLTGRQILESSFRIAEKYCQSPRSSVVLILLPHSVELFLLHLGLILTGRLPAILAWPTSRIDPEKYQNNLLHQLRNLPAAELLTLSQLARNLDPGLPYRVTPCEIPDADRWTKSFAVKLEVDPMGKCMDRAGREEPAEDALFLQFSGGTTGAQKCVVVTAPILEAQLRRLQECLRFTESDVVVSWLPMYHDMGLIACLWFPLWNGAPSVQFAAGDWLLDPGMLFRLLEQYRGTFSWLPNFAFSYLASQRHRMDGSCSLQHVRALVNCSEPVRLAAMKSFQEAFEDWGLDPAHLQASYAMAENVFAVTQTPLGSAVRTVPRSRIGSGAARELAYGMIDEVYVSSGCALGGARIRIRKSDGSLSGEEEPGDIEIFTDSLFGGYWGNDGFQRQAMTSDGWYATGDYGFLSAGDLYVIGRSKDIVIVGGQNVFPEDVEFVANTVDGVYPGRVVVFGVEDLEQGTESLAVVAEMRGIFESQQAEHINRQIHRTVLSAVGIAPRYVKVVPERWIVKSTAGKISRRETRIRFLAENGGSNRESH